MELTLTETEQIQEALHSLNAQVAALAEAQRRRNELFDEATPILREMLTVAGDRLDGLEQRGYFEFGKALLDVLDRIVTGYSPQDVRELAEAVVAILDAVRALTQPQMLRLVTDLSEAADQAAELQPPGVFGMLRAAKDVDAGRGIAVMIEVLRRLGHSAQRLDRKERLRAQLGPRKQRGDDKPRRTGVERPQRHKPSAPAQPPEAPAQEAAAQDPGQPTGRSPQPLMVDGVAFTQEGFLVDSKAWNRELAELLATSIGVELTDRHWQLIEFARQDYDSTGASPNIRRLTQGSGISTKEIYAMFPKAPGKCTALIAGLPKPVGCI